MLVSLGICRRCCSARLHRVIALPYALRSHAPWKETWLVGAYLATRHPVLALGVLSACGVTVWAAAHLSFALLVLLPAPLALIWAAAGSEACLRGRARLAGGGSSSSERLNRSRSPTSRPRSVPQSLSGRSSVARLDWPVLRSYDASHLERISLPLGGIGTGTVGLGGG